MSQLNVADARKSATNTLVRGVKSIFFSSEHHAAVHNVHIQKAANAVEEKRSPYEWKEHKLKRREEELFALSRQHKDGKTIKMLAQRICEVRREQEKCQREIRAINREGRIPLSMKRALETGSSAKGAILSAGNKNQQAILMQHLKAVSSELGQAYDASNEINSIASEIGQQFRDEGMGCTQEEFLEEDAELDAVLEEEYLYEERAAEVAKREHEARERREKVRASIPAKTRDRFDVASIMEEMGYSEETEIEKTLPVPSYTPPVSTKSHKTQKSKRTPPSAGTHTHHEERNPWRGMSSTVKTEDYAADYDDEKHPW